MSVMAMGVRICMILYSIQFESYPDVCR